MAWQVAVLRVLHQLSEVYSVMKIESLAALIPFFSSAEVEQLLVDAVKHGYLKVCLLPLCPTRAISPTAAVHAMGTLRLFCTCF